MAKKPQTHQKGAMKGIISKGKYKGYLPENVEEVKGYHKMLAHEKKEKQIMNKYRKYAKAHGE